MKILVATVEGGLDDSVSYAFGRCQTFTIVEIEGKKIINTEVVENEAKAAHGGAGITASQFVIDIGAEVVIAGNFGPKAFDVLSKAGIEIIQASGNVKEAVEAYLAGDLKPIKESTRSTHAGRDASNSYNRW